MFKTNITVLVNANEQMINDIIDELRIGEGVLYGNDKNGRAINTLVIMGLDNELKTFDLAEDETINDMLDIVSEMFDELDEGYDRDATL